MNHLYMYMKEACFHMIAIPTSLKGVPIVVQVDSMFKRKRGFFSKVLVTYKSRETSQSIAKSNSFQVVICNGSSASQLIGLSNSAKIPIYLVFLNFSEGLMSTEMDTSPFCNTIAASCFHYSVLSSNIRKIFRIDNIN